ncbi:hypothetical protein ACOME3_003820 [Neoechinorhynchus agilis]
MSLWLTCRQNWHTCALSRTLCREAPETLGSQRPRAKQSKTPRWKTSGLNDRLPLEPQTLSYVGRDTHRHFGQEQLRSCEKRRRQSRYCCRTKESCQIQQLRCRFYLRSVQRRNLWVAGGDGLGTDQLNRSAIGKNNKE